MNRLVYISYAIADGILFNNNNNNNIYYLQLGCHPVAVVILHVHKYEKKKVTRKFKSGGLHERHVEAISNIKKISGGFVKTQHFMMV